MAGKKKYSRPAPEVEPEAEAQRILPQIIKPYIDTITAQTRGDDVDADKLPEYVRIRFRGDPMGCQSNRYLAKSGRIYDFNGGVPVKIYDAKDKVWFILKARKNPETWEIVN